MQLSMLALNGLKNNQSYNFNITQRLNAVLIKN